ncbi:hypothetical protein QE400_000066 [Xanthomonas sacchari]|uniref:hypothetical protein n=1 Tax=Xanthomonas sacchari TaxID=56458 RepID=UPI00278B4A2A|nr:hypothetical protein [Xanthomonas sacchari]MDQ1090653.1 hypothetical protein [Xanthomonas sacchari]
MADTGHEQRARELLAAQYSHAPSKQSILLGESGHEAVRAICTALAAPAQANFGQFREAVETTSLTEDERNELISKLAEDILQSARNDRKFLENIILDGFEGFSTRSDEDLLRCHVDAFDEDFQSAASFSP